MRAELTRKMRNDFALLIISHGRADHVMTVKAIHRAGYTGRWYIILDNEDNQVEKYKKNFGEEHIIIFDKLAASKTFDIMDNFEGRQVPTYARNVLHQIAKDLGLTYFLELEDDYFNFRQRYLKEDDQMLYTRYVRDMDAVIDAYIEFLDKSGAVTVAFAQTGDFLGGQDSKVYKEKITRKAMNCFFCRTDRPFQCFGRFNDDVNSYLDNGKRGMIFLTPRDMCMDQPQTQARAGGITENYLKYGTYVKSFYSVMIAPNCVQVALMGYVSKRIHHLIDWEKAVPKIISSDFKKGETE